MQWNDTTSAVHQNVVVHQMLEFVLSILTDQVRFYAKETTCLERMTHHAICNFFSTVVSLL